MPWSVTKETRNSIWMMKRVKEWAEILEIYRKDKENRSIDNKEEGKYILEG